MASPASRQGLIDYCLRKLGHPVVEINVDDDQVNDRIDDAFQYYQDYHYDAIERVFLKQQVTASRLTLATPVGHTFSKGEFVIGQQSGAQATVTVEGGTTSYGTTLIIQDIIGTFNSSEVIIGNASNVSATLTAVTIGTVEQKYLERPEAVCGVIRVLPFTDQNSGLNMFDVRYQLRLNDMFDLLSTSIIYYEQVKQHLSLIEMLLVGNKSIEFKRHTNRLYINMNWGIDVKPGEFFVVECYRILDPNTYNDVYNDRFLKRYATSLIKRQWGENLKKFEGIQMPGGVTLNGQKIFDEAITEIENLEVEMRDTYTEPPNFMVG